MIAWDPGYVERLAGLALPNSRIRTILETLGFAIEGSRVQPPTWRRDVEGRADLVEEVARIAGYDALPAEPLPPMVRPASGVLTLRQSRLRVARRALAAAGYAEALTFSFVSQAAAKLFGGGADELVLANPISPELDCMRPSVLPSLIEAAGRNARRGFPDCALFEIGPVFAGTEPGDERTAIAAILAPHGPRRWDHAPAEDVFAIKADLMALLDELGAPVANLQVAQADTAPWWRPGRAARLQLGPKAVLAEFGEIHPKVLAALDVAGPVYAFEIWAEAIPEPKKKAMKTKPALALSPLMPLSRDFAFVVGQDTPAGDIVRAVQSRRPGADRRRAGVRRLPGPWRGRGQEVGRGRSHHPAARKDAGRRRDRGAVGPDRRRGGEVGRSGAARVAMDRVGQLRLVYVAALVNTGAAAAWMALGEVPAVFARGLPTLQLEIQAFGVFCFAVVGVPLWVLSRKPRWWGKLLLLACGVSWIGHAAIAPFATAGLDAHVPALWIPLSCGVVMLALAVAHQILDPSFSQRPR